MTRRRGPSRARSGGRLASRSSTGGRLRRKLGCRRVDRGAQRVNAVFYVLSILLALATSSSSPIMDETYNSDSSESSIAISSSVVPESADDPAFERYKGQQFVIIDHTANIRNRSEVSKIWKHGSERRRVDDGTFDRYWRCGHCQHKKILKCLEGGGGKTSYPICYL